jgi:hypothetical protein
MYWFQEKSMGNHGIYFTPKYDDVLPIFPYTKSANPKKA